MALPRRSVVPEAMSLGLLVTAAVAGSGSGVFDSPVSVATMVVISVASVGLVTSSIQRVSGAWWWISIAGVPALGTAMAVAASAPWLQNALLALPVVSIAVIALWQQRLDDEAPRWPAVVVAVAATATASIDMVLRDPFRELRCRPICPQNPWVLQHDATVLAVTGWLLLGVVAAAATATMLHANVGRAAPSAVICAWAAMASSAAARAVRSRYHPDDAVARWLLATELLLVAATGALSIRPSPAAHLGRRRVNRWIATVENATHGGVLGVLQNVSGDPTVRFVEQPIHSVDRVVTAVRRHGAVIAFIEHRADRADRLRAALVPIVVELVENDRLTAQAASQLTELRAARRQAIERIDDARAGLQRDLHDGAQQHLIALGMALADLAADAREPSRGMLDTATHHAAAALEALRAVAHADLPAVLDDEGLEEALRSFAEESELDLALSLPDRPSRERPRDVEHAAYRFVRAAAAEAAAAGADRLAVRAHDAEGGLVVTTSRCTNDTPLTVLETDRIDAAGGVLTAIADAGSSGYCVRFP